MKRVLFDSDVLLDVLAQRQPFVIASAQALNRLFFERYLSDGDLSLIIEQHKQYKGKLEKYFIVMYHRALDFRAKQYFGVQNNEDS